MAGKPKPENLVKKKFLKVRATEAYEQMVKKKTKKRGFGSTGEYIRSLIEQDQD